MSAKMSFRSFGIRLALVAAVWALADQEIGSAQTSRQRRGRPIEFTDPRVPDLSTNLAPANTTRDSVKEYEEGLFGSPKKVSPQSSLEGVLAPPSRRQPGPAILNKRVQDLIERRKNWMFMSPQEMMSGPTAEEVLKYTEYGLDGKEKQGGPSPENYLDRQDEEKEGRSDRRRGDRKPGEDRYSSEREENLRRVTERMDDLMGAKKDSEGSGRDLFASDDDEFGSRKSRLDSETKPKGFFDSDSVKGGFFQSETRDSAGDPFWSTSDKGSSASELTKAQKARREAFEKLLPAPLAATPNLGGLNPLGGVAESKLPTTSVLPPADLFDSPARGGVESRFLGTLTPFGGGLSEASSKLSGFSSPAVAIPKYEPPRLVAPTPNFIAPKRAF